MNKFIKIANPETAKYLSSLGFQYILEQNVFVFAYSEQLLSLIKESLDCSSFAFDNKLRF